jgi:hypothetical protein
MSRIVKPFQFFCGRAEINISLKVTHYQIYNKMKHETKGMLAALIQ